MALVGSLLVSMSARTEDFERGMQRARTQVSQTQQAVGQARVSFEGIGASITRGLGPIAAGLISLTALKTGLETVVQAGIKAQQLESAFTQITGSAKGSEAALSFVRATADKLGLSFNDLADAYKGLTAAARGTTLEGAQTEQIFTAITSASRALQLSGQDTQGILLAVQQIMSKGTVAAEELRGQIGERLPGAFSIAARAMGVTTAELGKMLETGQILSTSFLPRFAQQLQRELGGGADVASKTFSASLARLGNAVQDAATQVAKSGFLDWLGMVLDKLTAVIKAGPEAARALDQVAKSRVQQGVTPLQTQGLNIPEAVQRDLEAIQRRIIQTQDLIQSIQQRSAGGKGFITDPATLDVLRAKLAALQKQYNDLYESIRKTAQTGQEFQEGLNTGSAPSRYTQALELQRQIFEQFDKADQEIRRIEAQSKLTTDAQERLKLYQQQLEVLTKLREAIQQAIVRAPGLEPVLNTLGRQVDVTDAVTGAPAKIRVTVQSTLDAVERAITETRDRIAESARQGVLGDVQVQAFDDIVAKVKALGEQIKPIQENILEQTRKFIEDYNKLHTNAPLGEAQQRLLLDLARRAEAQRKAIIDAKEAEESFTAAYEGFYDRILAADTATEEQVQERVKELERTTADYFEDLDKKTNQGFNAIVNSANRLADTFTDVFATILSGGEISFKQLSNTIIRELLNIAIQASGVRQELEKLFTKGAISLANLFSGGTGGGAGAASSGIDLAAIGQYASDIGAGLQSGGPIMPNRFYTVGEKGPEVLYTGNLNGRVFSNEQAFGGRRGGDVYITVYAQDAGSFLRSTGEINYRIAQAQRNIQRDI